MPTPKNAPYKVRSAEFKRRARQCVVYGNGFQKFWTSDGQGYQRDCKSGAIRRIPDAAPVGFVQRIRQMLRA